MWFATPALAIRLQETVGGGLDPSHIRLLVLLTEPGVRPRVVKWFGSSRLWLKVLAPSLTRWWSSTQPSHSETHFLPL